MAKNTIAPIVKDDLCTGCGTCSALCPKEAINLTINVDKGIYAPNLDENRCNKCGICYKVCPGLEVDFKQLNMAVFGKDPNNYRIGNYFNCYTGFSNDHDIRYNSTSGGLITQLLLFALEEGIIDGALVTRMKKDYPLEPEPFIAKTKWEIIEASKSKYCPVPANVALNEIMKSKQGMKFAVVGLPCHIQAIRKAEQVDNKLKEKIALHIGIFCNHTPTFLATEFMLEKIKIKKDDVKELTYREKGWPGKMSISLEATNRILDYGEYWGSVGKIFYPMRCTTCCDHTAELADVSFGDAWLPEIQKRDAIGTSIFISRNFVGDKLLKDATLENKINLELIDSSKVIQSQKQGINFKKRDLKGRMVVLNALGKKTPHYNSWDLHNPTLKSCLSGLTIYIRIYLSSKKYLWNLLIFYQSLRRKIINSVRKLVT